MEPYVLLKFGHVFLAIVAVGFNMSYGLWLARAEREPQHLGYVLASVRVLDRVANAAYGLLLVTGLALLWVGAIPLTTFWILAALVLYVAAVVVGIAVYAPTLRGQIQALAASGPQSPEYRGYSARGRMLGILTALFVIAIVFLMVAKPTLG
jgi:uncharacterized membrane protein